MVQLWIWLSLIHPVDAWIVKRHAVAKGDLEPEPLIASARFKQQDVKAPACRKSVGHDAPCGSCAYNNEIEFGQNI
jgi:hypothetical protein